MDKSKRKRKKKKQQLLNLRRPLFRQVVSNYPVIENKQHDLGTENKKKKAWVSILNEFNSKEKANQLFLLLFLRHIIIKHINLPLTRFNLRFHLDLD